jgi:phosphatidylethanolamine/phosphatidyl-N-methylethanolamine N-methyltransferase
MPDHEGRGPAAVTMERAALLDAPLAVGTRGRRAAVGEAFAFLRAWLAAPRRVAALAPSGAALARLITSEISAADAPVIELGAGTGAFTRALLERGVPEAQLVLVETDANLARLLRVRFPGARVLMVDAARLRSLGGTLDGTAAGAVVSGLPLLAMSPKRVAAVLAGAFAWSRPGAAVYQFTYGPRCPIPPWVAARMDLNAERIGGTFANLPPASVYRITRGAGADPR